MLKNKVVIITGASSGIGEASAKLLASKGAKVVLGARRVAGRRKEEINSSKVISLPLSLAAQRRR